MLQAVIMAGGVGSRLRPLTCDLPKPMARLCGRPNLEYSLDLLGEHGVVHAAVAVQYLPQSITEHFESGMYGNIALSFVEETTPLGTAGSVKQAAKGFEEDFFVISGDALCDFDLTAALRHHKQRGAAVSIVVKAVEDPREYGLVKLDEAGDVAAFVEKPCYSQAVSNLANTGVYILNPRILGLIPSHTTYDFAGDLFPRLLARGLKIAAFEDHGYWCDIGDVESYRTCQQDMLRGKVRCRMEGTRDKDGNIFKDARPRGSYTIVPPVYLGEHVSIGEGAVLDGLSVIDDGVRISAGARVYGGVMLQNSYAGKDSAISGAVLCAGASAQQQAMLFENAVLGAGSVAGAGSVIRQGVRIWPGKQVEAGVILRDNLKYGAGKAPCFGEEGLCGAAGAGLTPELAVRVGLALGTLAKGGRVGVGCTEDRSARVLRQALVAGVLAAGADVLDFGGCFQALFCFDLSFCALGLGVYLQGTEPAGLRIFTTGGLPATRVQERALEGALARGDYSRCPPQELGEASDLSGMRVLYENELLRYAPKGLAEVGACIKSANRGLANILQNALQKLGAAQEASLTLQLSAAGDTLSLSLAGVGYLSHQKLLAIVCVGEFRQGNAVALPFDAPPILEELAAQYGGRVLRYLSCPADLSDAAARKLACTQPWVRDALLLAVKLLEQMQREKITPHQLFTLLPRFESASLLVATEKNPARAIQSLGVPAEKSIGEGILLRETRGVVLVKPLKRGGGVRLTAQAQSTEIAMELCESYRKIISAAAQQPLH